jgi:hypothetical protein
VLWLMLACSHLPVWERGVHQREQTMCSMQCMVRSFQGRPSLLDCDESSLLCVDGGQEARRYHSNKRPRCCQLNNFGPNLQDTKQGAGMQQPELEPKQAGPGAHSVCAVLNLPKPAPAWFEHTPPLQYACRIRQAPSPVHCCCPRCCCIAHGAAQAPLDRPWACLPSK